MDRIKPFEPLWGSWICEAVLGEGSFGRVYRAVRKEGSRRYYSAVKHISVPAGEQQLHEVRSSGNYRSDAEVSQYFDAIAREVSREIDFMYALKGNKNIVSYEDHMVIPKKNGIGCDIFIRMELLCDLNNVNTPISPSEAVKIGIDICSALEVCTEKNIIHRDIKPSNIFVNADGDYKLGDFGIARVLSGTTTGMSKKGTYSYMSPEIYKCEPANFTSDIYSLGVVLYKLLNDNRLPFIPLTGVVLPNHNEEALLKMVSGVPMPPPVNASPVLSSVILQACSYNKRDRFQHPSAFKKALMTAPEFSEAAPTPDKKSVSDSPKKKGSSAAPKKRRILPKLLAILFVLLVIAASFIGISYFSSQSDSSESQSAAAAQALSDYDFIKTHYTVWDFDALMPVFNSLSAYADESDECRKACGDGIFTLLKFRGNTYASGSEYSFRFYSVKDDPTFYINYNMWNQKGIQGYLFDADRGCHGIVTITYDGITYTDWFEIVSFDDPTSLRPASVTVKHPKTNKEYIFTLQD